MINFQLLIIYSVLKIQIYMICNVLVEAKEKKITIDQLFLGSRIKCLKVYFINSRTFSLI